MIICEIKYDGENDGIIMENVNKHFKNDNRVHFNIPGVNCPDDFDGFTIVVPCFLDGEVSVKHKVCIGDTVHLFYGHNGFPQVEVIHA
jgi:hypothetical protein